MRAPDQPADRKASRRGGPKFQLDCCQPALVAIGCSGDATALCQHNAKGPRPTELGRGLSLGGLAHCSRNRNIRPDDLRFAERCRRAIPTAGQARPGMSADAGQAGRQASTDCGARWRDNQDHGRGGMYRPSPASLRAALRNAPLPLAEQSPQLRCDQRRSQVEEDRQPILDNGESGLQAIGFAKQTLAFLPGEARLQRPLFLIYP
jgi:hypothetical protein